MNLEINKNLEQTKAKNKDVESFINELSQYLSKNENSIYDECLKEIPLAVKYTKQLSDIINECMKDMSYNREFYYFDYDKQTQEYYWEYYSDGEVTRMPYWDKNEKIDVGTIWRPYKDSELRLADHIKEGVKSNVEYELDMIDLKNRKGE